MDTVSSFARLLQGLYETKPANIAVLLERDIKCTTPGGVNTIAYSSPGREASTLVTCLPHQISGPCSGLWLSPAIHTRGIFLLSKDSHHIVKVIQHGSYDLLLYDRKSRSTGEQ